MEGARHRYIPAAVVKPWAGRLEVVAVVEVRLPVAVPVAEGVEVVAEKCRAPRVARH